MATIKKITLDNFKSFGHLEFDLTEGKKTLPYAFIYGENGSGKTNLLESISFLKKSLLTLAREPKSDDKEKELVETFGKLIDMMKHDSENDNLKQSVMDLLIPKDLPYLTAQYRMIGSEEGMRIGITLDIDGHDATYAMAFDGSNNLVQETLRYLANERITDLFDLHFTVSEIQMGFSPLFFKDDGYGKNVKESIKKYWGKHSLLSIMNHERIKNNVDFMKNSVTDNLFIFMDSLNGIRTESGPIGELLCRVDTIKYNPQSGTIAKDHLDELRNYETALNKAFTRIYSDVRKVYFKTEDSGENKLEYTLCFVRHIHGKDREIPAALESSGTRKLLSIFPFLLDCAAGRTVMIDEMDSGIHDKLVFDLITEILSEIKGQLIITTHNTSLLRILEPKGAFIINVDLNGEREIRSICKILRTQKNHNNQDRYLKGVLDGVPYMGSLDLDEIAGSYYNREAQ